MCLKLYGVPVKELVLIQCEGVPYQTQVADSKYQSPRDRIDILKPSRVNVGNSPEISPDKIFVITEALRTCFDDYMIQRRSLQLTRIGCTASSLKQWK